jgi:hypothetical protein
MFCPVCLAEYRSEFTRCSECDVPLVSSLPDLPPDNPEDHAELIAIRSYANEAEANVARTLLEAAGIESMVPQDPKGGLPHALYPSQGVDLLVRPQDRQAAEDVLGAGESGENALTGDVL